MGLWSLSSGESYALKLPLWFINFPSLGIKAPKSDLSTIAPKQKNYHGLTLTWQQRIPGTSTWIWEAGTFKKGKERRQHQKEVRCQNLILRGKFESKSLCKRSSSDGMIWKWKSGQNKHVEEMKKQTLVSPSFSYSAVPAPLHRKRGNENEIMIKVMEGTEEC